MKLSVRVKAGTKIEKLEKTGDTSYSVWVKAPPEDGEANAAVISALSDHFGIPQRNVMILAGHKSKNKIVGIKE